MAMARFQAAGSSSTTVPVGSRMAAPLTRTRGAPCAAMAALTAPAMLASLVTSQRCAMAAPPALAMRAAVALAACSSISRQATLAPASAKAKAMARPMPSAAPTTMAGLPSRRKGLSGITPALVLDRFRRSRHGHLRPDCGRFAANRALVITTSIARMAITRPTGMTFMLHGNVSAVGARCKLQPIRRPHALTQRERNLAARHPVPGLLAVPGRRSDAPRTQFALAHLAVLGGGQRVDKVQIPGQGVVGQS